MNPKNSPETPAQQPKVDEQKEKIRENTSSKLRALSDDIAKQLQLD